MKLFKKKHNSQFLKDCDTDWNLNIEFIHWLRYWCKEYREKAQIHLDFHVIEAHKGVTLTQGEAIDRLIDLCDDFLSTDYYDEKNGEIVDEIFDLFHKLFWYMWW